ncbi:MAG: membrane protein insertase YidC [Acidobacteriota bacterium]|nr:membrane protein insertase YidC [Acidobacteriota bacterium]
MIPPTKTGKKDLPMEARLLLAFVLMGLVIFATPYFYKLVLPPPVKKAATVSNQPSNVASAAVSDATQSTARTASANTPAAAATETVAASAESTPVVDTDEYHVVFSNRGAVVRSWTLKDYKDRSGKPLEIVNAAAAPKVGYPFSFSFRDKKPSVNLNQALFVANPSSDGLSVAFEYSNNGLLAKKKFSFEKNGYLSHVETEVTQNGVPLPNLIEWRGGFGDFAVPSAASQQSTIHFDTGSSKLVRENAKAAKNGPVNADGIFSFAGIEDQYFTAAFLPSGSGALETTTFNDSVPTVYDKKDEPFVGTAIGGAGTNSLALFVGPKDIETLRKVNPKLEQIVDFGWFGILAKPLFLVLRLLNNQFVHNYGWSIVIVTIIINVLLFPLKLTNMKSMKKMQRLQPQIAAINEKYKSMKLTDPRQGQKNQETMDLYKANGANPMGGCLPLLIQMPFLFAFYKVLAVSIEMRNASWLWVTDLSQPERIAIHVLPILMIITGFIMQKMTPVAGGDPNQQKMMAFMPLFMGFFFYSVQSGLVLYWLTGNLVGIAQQWFFNKTMTPVESGPAVQVSTQKKIARK